MVLFVVVVVLKKKKKKKKKKTKKRRKTPCSLSRRFGTKERGRVVVVVVVVVVVIIIMEDNGADDDDEKKTEEDKEDKEDKEKEEEKDGERELSLLLSKCHAALKRARETVAEASVMRFDDDDDDDVDTRKNFAAAAALKTDDDDDGQKRTREMMMHSMAGRVERMVEECKETLEEIERKTTHLSTKTYRGGGDADAKEEKERRRQEFVRAMRTETRTMRRDVEEVLKHAESARKGERRQLIPEPMKEAPKTKDETREEKIQQQQQHQPEDRFLFWKTSAKTYLRKAKKKMDSVATQTKNAVKKYARSKSYDDAEGQQKETERYSDAQRQREMREEEEIRRMRRYGYESTKSTNARSREDEHLEENVDKDDEDAQRRALFAKIAPTITPTPSTSSSLPNNATTAKNSYDINAARNSTLSANRSAIALENSLHHAERAERAGRDTLENLRRQRETLQRTSGHVQSATRTADENAKLVKKMSHWSRLGC